MVAVCYNKASKMKVNPCSLLPLPLKSVMMMDKKHVHHSSLKTEVTIPVMH